MANHQLISSFTASSSASSSHINPKKYDVFLSFRGEDTRNTFTSHLHSALCQKKVETYIDYRLEKGDQIGPELIKAIKESHMSVVIFSKNYANSKWCLDEISNIMECRKNHGHIVKPIFYNIDPSNVRRQTGSYEEDFKKHEEDLKYNKDKVHKWKAALTEAANLAGWDSTTYSTEAELIRQIVGDVLKRLKHIHMGQSNQKVLVGIQEKVTSLVSLTTLDSEAVRVIGIWGMGGIGKTILAKEIYDTLRYEYDAACFMQNVRENLEKYGVTCLQNELVCTLLDDKNPGISNPIIGCQYNLIRLRRKKVLLVLDDVNNLRKVIDLYGRSNWFGKGSRVIVTSRDKEILTNLADDIYEVDELEFEDSLKLFSLHAFKENCPNLEWMDLSIEAVKYAKGIPLVAEVLGSSLYGKEREVWESELKKLQKMPLPEIQDILRLSYDGLDQEEKDIFLYLACFFEEEYRFFSSIIFMLDNCGYSTNVGLKKLYNKALIYEQTEQWKEIMHDLIREMGKDIVCKESKDPGKRCHLWDSHDVYQVLENSTGTGTIQSLKLFMRSDRKELCLSPKAFDGMSNLKFLKLDTYDSESQKIKITAFEDSTSLPKGLRFLEWIGCPLKSLGSLPCAENLIELRLSYSNLERLWDGVQNLVNLRQMLIHYCVQLMELPDFSMAVNLEDVVVAHCTRLLDLHPSFLSLQNLSKLNLNGCKNLKSIWSEHKGCTSLKELSLMSENMEILGLEKAGIVEVNSLGFPLNKLEYWKCGFSKTLPHNFLQQLNLWDTLDLFDKRCYFKSLTILDFSDTDVESLDTSINLLFSLTILRLNHCKRLRCIPPLPPNITCFEASECVSLEGVSLSTVDSCLNSNTVEFIFWECRRLNQQSLNSIMSFAHVQINGAAYFQHLRQPIELDISRIYSDIAVGLPVSKVPADRYEYKTTTKLTMSFQLSNLSNLMALSFCFVVSVCQQEPGRLCGLTIGQCTCSLLTSDGQEDSLFSVIRHYGTGLEVPHPDSNQLLICYPQEFSERITDTIKERRIENEGTTYDPTLSFTITPREGRKISEWGVHPIYTSDLFSFSVPLALETKSKRYRDIEEFSDMEPLPPTKKLKSQKSLRFQPSTSINWYSSWPVSCLLLKNWLLSNVKKMQMMMKAFMIWTRNVLFIGAVIGVILGICLSKW